MTNNRQRTGWRAVRGVATAVAVTLSFVALGVSTAQAQPDPYTVPLQLMNGWTSGPFSTQQAGVKQLNDGVVAFTGAISNSLGLNANPLAFILPVNDRPATNVYVPVDQFVATKGRLLIQPNGDVWVEAEGSFTNATQFTSLDGVTFALPTASNTPLALQNGWQGAPYGTGAAGVQFESYVSPWGGPTQRSVHFTGAIMNPNSNASTLAFTLPAGYAPPTNVYVPVDMCNATNGRLIIQPSGQVTVQAESLSSNAACFTSLDGAWFNLDTGSLVTPLVPQNGWQSTPYGTATPAIEGISSSTVEFTGAIMNPDPNGNSLVFKLPAGYAPPTNVYVQVDMCGATKGRLDILPSGEVFVQSEGPFTNATCFTSLDGVSYTLWTSPPG